MKQKSLDYEYNRIWVKKPTGGLRPPLPSAVNWRMVANTVQLFMIMWLFPRMPDRRFKGGLPSRDPETWWKEVITNRLLNSKFIYEFDMSKYFDTISLNTVKRSLSAKEFPLYL